MIVKGIIDEDFVNYKQPSMTIMMPCCNFKCGEQACQNSALAKSPDTHIDYKEIVSRYLNNPITKAIVFSGLDPVDSIDDVLHTIYWLRAKNCYDDVVIYTGYTEDEVSKMTIDVWAEWFYDNSKHEVKCKVIDYLKELAPIVVKYGRYVPGQQPHYDEVLGVNLASDNQYARRYG